MERCTGGIRLVSRTSFGLIALGLALVTLATLDSFKCDYYTNITMGKIPWVEEKTVRKQNIELFGSQLNM